MNQIICPKCGQLNRAGAKFCTKCQASIPAPPPSPSPPFFPGAPAGPLGGPSPAGQFPAPPVAYPARRNHWLWIAIGLVSLLIIAAVAILFWQAGKDGTSVADVTPTAEAEVGSETTEIPVVPPTLQPDPTEAVEESIPTLAATEVPETTLPQPTPFANLLSNGNFAQNWDQGWQRTLGPNASGSQRTEVIDVGRGTTGRGLHIERSGPDQLYLEQRVTVNPSSLHFSAEVKLVGSIDESTNTEGIGVLMLVYHDTNQAPLGYSIWVNGNQRTSLLFGVGSLPPVGNNVSRYWLGNEWHKIDIDLRQEIINSLPTVNPDEINAITVILLAMGSDSCSPDGCPVDIRAADLLLSSE